MSSLLLAVFGLGALAVLIAWIRSRIFYWKLKGIPSASSVPLLGSYMPMLLQRFAVPDFQKYLYNVHTEANYTGMMDFNTPSLVIRDPQLIKQLGVKHFDSFPDHKKIARESNDTFFGKMMYFTTGKRWKDMNSVVRQAFTASKIRYMSELVSQSATDFVRYLLRHPEQTESIEIKDAFTRFTAEAVAAAAFGIRVDCMEDKNNAFHKWGKHATDLGSLRVISKIILFRAFPTLARWFGVSFVAEKYTRFFRDLVRENMASRKRLNLARPDLIHLLTEASEADNGVDITEDDVIAQAFNFFFASFEVSSTLMCCAAHEIAVNEDVQDKLRAEVDRCREKAGGEISFECLNESKYFDAVVAEVLRKYPPLPFADRVCRKPFELPPAVPGADPVTVEPGMYIFFPIYALQHDPKYFPDPDRFDPGRFSEENKSKLTPYSYMPFGVGPRICPGDRFAVMMVKIVLANLIANFVLKPTKKTSIPLRFCKKSLSMDVHGGFWLELEPRKSRGA